MSQSYCYKTLSVDLMVLNISIISHCQMILKYKHYLTLSNDT